jgi:hypothetical protein
MTPTQLVYDLLNLDDAEIEQFLQALLIVAGKPNIKQDELNRIGGLLEAMHDILTIKHSPAKSTFEGRTPLNQPKLYILIIAVLVKKLGGNVAITQDDINTIAYTQMIEQMESPDVLKLILESAPKQSH